MKIKVIRSHKRRRTISARVVGEVMCVNAPAEISEEELEKIVKNFQRRFEKRRYKKELNAKEDLNEVLQKLNEKYFDGSIKVKSIEYTTNQSRMFGSCNHRKKTIRISSRLSQMPDWVKDYVIIHEMAHIIHPNHSRSFWDIVSRYSLTERAKGYLMAKGFEAGEESDIED